jgi:glycosyltransferase involved in cell wall biosynthesis
LKIIFASVFYLPQAVGGIEYYIHNLAKGLLQKGFDVKIAVPAYEDYDINMNDYVLDGLQVIRFNGYNAESNKLHMAGVVPNESLAHFKKLLEREKPDVVHFNQLTNSSGISLHHIQTAKECGAKIVYTNHLAEFICLRGDLRYKSTTACDGIVTNKKCTSCMLQKKGMNKTIAAVLTLADSITAMVVGKKNYTRQLMPVTFPGFAARWQISKIESVIMMSDRFVSIAEWSSNLLKKNGWYNTNCITIKTGLFKNIPVQNSSSNYDGKRPLKIIYMGRIVPVKDLAVLIKAVKKIDTGLAELHIYGPKGHLAYSTYIDECRDLATGFHNIIFHTPVDNSEVVRLMKEHDILCLPSRGIEMAPLVIQEAMAAGIPVLGSSLPAIEEWVKDGQNGLIFSISDESSLQAKLMEIINNPALLQSLKDNIKPPQSFETVVDDYARLYRSLFN